MGTYKSKSIKGNVYELDQLEESPPDVKAKTRAPKPGLWKLNILRGKREDELKDESMPLARRRCRTKATKFIECERVNGKYWTVFECIEEYETMNECFQRELEIETDKLRRDMQRHPEWWWREMYDEEGEVGDQAAWNNEWFGTLLFWNFKQKYFGSSPAEGVTTPAQPSQSPSPAADKNTTQ